MTIVEVHKIPETDPQADAEGDTGQRRGTQRPFGTPFKARFRDEWYQLDLSLPSTSQRYQDALIEDDEDCRTQQSEDLKQKIICGRLHGGHTAFIATQRGLVRWKFLLDPNATQTGPSGESRQEEQKGDEDQP